jgi:hypothetical protein
MMSLGRGFFIILLIPFLASLMLVPIYGLSAPRYPPQKYPEITPGLIAVYGDKLVIYDYGSRSIQVLDTKRWESRVIKVGEEPNDVAVLDRWLVIGLDYGLEVIDLETWDTRRFEAPARVEDLEMGDGLIWASIPLQDLILGIDPASLEVKQMIEINVASGRDRISVVDGFLWAVEGDGMNIMKIDLKTMSRSSMRLGEGAVTIRAFRGGALAATTGDKIIEISDDLRTRRTWRLANGSSTDIQLYVLGDGRIIYVSPSRWVIGEIDGDRITEVRAEARIGGSALAGDRIWFTEPSKKRIGYAPLSRPPRIIEFKVERIDGNVYRAYADVSDPDNDLSKVYLITYYPELVGPAQNRTYEMSMEDGRHVMEFTVDYGRRVEIYAAAVDAYDNVAKSETIVIKAEKVETITTQQTIETGQGAQITPADIYTLASSLLLLIPIIIGFFYLRGRRKKRRARR